MNAFEVQLDVHRLGAEVLISLARERASGVLTWSVSGAQCQLVFVAGRPTEAIYGQAVHAQDREPVIGILRSFAVINSGTCAFAPSADGQPRADAAIDTMGEVVVAILKELRVRPLQALWDARAGETIEVTETFERLVAAVVQAGGSAVRKPLRGATVGTLIAGASEDAQRAWACLLALGAVRCRPTNLDSHHVVPGTAGEERGGVDGAAGLSAELRALQLEVERFHRTLPKTHYEMLGVDTKAGADAIRKAYFDHAKRWHSDRFTNKGFGPGVLKQAEELFRAAEDAHRVLTDPKERSNYDFVLDRQAKGLPTDPKVIFAAENLFRRGETLIRRGQGAAAEPILRQAVQLNPGEGEFSVFLGYALYCARGPEALGEARALIEKGLQLRPKVDAAHEFLGRMARAQGDLKQAEQHLKKALEMNPKNVEAQREMRFVHMRASEKKSDKGLGGLLGKVLKR